MPIRKERLAEYPADWKAISARVRARNGGWCEFCQIAKNGELHPVTGSKVVLTCAHLDHDHTHGRDEDLAALCQRCHLTYDATQHKRNAKRTLWRKRGQEDLLP